MEITATVPSPDKEQLIKVAVVDVIVASSEGSDITLYIIVTSLFFTIAIIISPLSDISFTTERFVTINILVVASVNILLILSSWFQS